MYWVLQYLPGTMTMLLYFLEKTVIIRYILLVLYYYIIVWYSMYRMFCEHQTFANFAMVDQFASIKSAKPTSKYTRSLPERNS